MHQIEILPWGLPLRCSFKLPISMLSYTSNLQNVIKHKWKIRAVFAPLRSYPWKQICFRRNINESIWAGNLTTFWEKHHFVKLTDHVSSFRSFRFTYAHDNTVHCPNITIWTLDSIFNLIQTTLDHKVMLGKIKTYDCPSPYPPNQEIVSCWV